MFGLLIGGADQTRPNVMADRAIEFADLMDQSYTICIDPATRLVWLLPPAQVSASDHAVATFTRKADPDWLAEEIAEAIREIAPKRRKRV
ncbi:hypothetical protein [Thermomonas hydrothermalis]|uniref:Uncharacterized protein n=1 Tax=Thermomonas hydrothermalis TaxID=213588 RepID=A0A1M5B3S3_9GAMM|nr:hypothetical protein [Thermomonas hydrothermalis]SHF37143.1 hypothetical protein SAMN02745204_02355 [Thermomonas hydrothermalis]